MRKRLSARCLGPVTGVLCGVFCVVGLASPALPQSGGAVPNQQSDEVIYCHDAKLRVVQRKLVGDCTGEVVTREQADRISAETIERRRRMLANPRKPLISGRKLRSIGTGFFVTTDGKLLTNNHVVDECAALSVETPDGRTAEARLIDTQPANDLALLEVPLKAKAAAKFLVSGAMTPGEPVVVIGYPDQGLAPIKPLLTRGTLGGSVILAGGRSRFEIRADVRHGNSGGPVTDVRGLVIGVVYAKVNSVAVFQKTGKTVRFVGAVIDNRAVIGFLKRNNVPFRTAGSAPEIGAPELQAQLQLMVVRVGCWR